MKDYTSNEPVFSSAIKIVETSDPAHADNINAATTQLLQNTLANRNILLGLFGFTYEGDGLLNNIIGCSLDGETLIIPAAMASVEDETLCLTDGIPFDSSGSGGTDYVLPAATTTTLGGVIVGSGIEVAEDGTISTDIDTIAEMAATAVEENTEDYSAEEIQNLLNED